MAAEELIASEEDLLYEEDLLRNAYSLKYWVRYLGAKRSSPARQRNLLAERALKYLPGSYKLWRPYLNDRVAQVKNRRPDDPAVEHVNRAYERALVYMHKMPRLWEDYLQFLMRQHKIGPTRHAFDRALRALPITQHERIWTLYVDFAKKCPVKETAVRIYRRYLQFEPDGVEDYIEYLLSIDRVSEAALKLAELLNKENAISTKGKSRHKLWMELCEMCVKNPQAVKQLRVEAIIRSGLRTFTDEVGHLWCALADFFIRQAGFEQARDVYEEAIASVVTVRDFSMVFDAYSQFEESMLTAKLEQYGEAQLSEEQQLDVDMRLARLERLMERRPELLSSVLLRQNPHNVHEWLKRARLFDATPAKVIHTYATAVKTVDPAKAIGKPHTLWLTFARYYEDHGDLKNARVILRKASLVAYRVVDDLAAVWMGWAEMELRHKKYDQARAVLKEATTVPPPSQRSKDESGPVQGRLYRHTKLWAFYADLQESLGTFEETKKTYEAILDLRIITPQLVLNFAAFLEENKYFEASFQAYERGVAAFRYPHVLPIWLQYLTKFVGRFKGSKLERARDLFEQALDKCPSDVSAQIFLLYAKLEEEHGLMRNAMAIYQRAVEAVALEKKAEVYNVYIAKAAEYFGVTKTRDIYEHAINALPTPLVPSMCERYANLERKLGELDRARAIYMHGSQQVDPAAENSSFWQVWHDFEVSHGNEDTFREMLRIKRAVRAQHTSAAVVHARPGDKRKHDDAAAKPPNGAEGKAEVLAALASFYLLCKPFAPVRLGGALFVTPDVKNFIEARPALVSFLESAAQLWDASFGLVFATLSAPVRRELLKDEFLELARESRGGIDPLDAKKQARLDEIVTTLLPALNPTSDPASSPLFSGEWECRWTTEAELNFAVDKGLFGLPWERTYQTIDVPSRVLTNVIEFEDGALTVESSVVPNEVDRARFNFAFSECSLRYKSITVPLPPVGRGWGELLYLDSDLRIQRDIRGDLLVAERVTESS